MLWNRILHSLATCAAVAAISFGLMSTARAQSPIPIAAIQASPQTYVGTEVTVEGNVTVPINYRGPTFYSGYIQDGSGRGINIFGGSTAVPNATALNTLGRLVRVRGEVAIFQTTTIELVNIAEVTDLGSTTPVIPIKLSSLAANDARWEGTLIESSGNVVSSATGGAARNYTFSDGSGPMVARVYDVLGVPTIANGTAVIGRGAGTKFGTTFQFYVGQASDFAPGTPPADTQAPLLTGAWPPAANQVVVTFAEVVDTATGSNAANYEVFETATPANTVAVNTVTLAGPVATLALGSSLATATGYTVRVSNVRDLANNPIGTPITRTFTSAAGSSDTTPPTLVGAGSSSLTSVTATFSEAIDPTSGGTAANYSVVLTSNPSTTFTVTNAVVSGVSATLTLGSSLAAGTGYTLRVQNVQDLATNTMVGQQTATFTTSGGGGVTPIATIHQNLSTYLRQTVTIEAQVYIPTNYRAPAATITGYVQDSSGRGINLFGNAFNVAAVQDVGNIVRVTGVVDTFGTTTVEILNPTSVTVVSSGNPPLQPLVLGTGAAASPQREGTFIQTSGTITRITTTAGSSPARNYQVNDGSGPVVIRVINSLNTPTFNMGDQITGRGAGSHFGSDYQILVGATGDVFLGSGSDTTPPTLSSASTPSLSSVRATFSEAIDPATGGATANYSVFETSNPGTTFAVTAAAVSGVNATLTLASALTSGTNYSLRAQSVQDVAGNPMAAAQTVTFTAATGPTITPIATIHQNLSTYLRQTVTIEAQVYIPSNYRAPATTISGYVQDSSGRGINLFGSAFSNPAVQDVGNIVRVTGVVDTFGVTTVEILNPTNITLVSGGNPPLQPLVLGTGAAASPQREGTFIQTTGTITRITTTAGSSPARNYQVNDGTGPVVIRVINSLNTPVFNMGDQITGRGAGSHFGSDYQILVGRPGDVFLGGGGSDTTPPNLTSASTPSLTSVRATFNEAIDPVTGGTASNYTVFETATPGNTFAVTGATVSGVNATLTLATSLASGTNYTLRAQNIEDTSNNTMPAPQTVTFSATVGPATVPIATIHQNLQSYLRQTVTIQGQIYIPTNYRAPEATTTTGYIQDGSGRGINLFGSGFTDAMFRDIGNIVRVTGVVDTFGVTTVELLNGTGATLVSSGNAPLQPAVLSTGDAASAAWEGTYIQVTGRVLSFFTTGGTSPARNYNVDDGSGPLVVRVINNLGAPVFVAGDTITARGAGSHFRTDYQILVGLPGTNGVFEGSGPDTFYPTVLGATASGSQVTIDFNEPVSEATAEVPANYEVFRSSNPAEVIAVTGATRVEPRKVVLDLASPLDVALGYTVRVRNVTDALGNPIPAAGVTHAITEGAAEEVSMSGPKNTFLPRQGESYPITITVPGNADPRDSEVLLRIFDMRGQLKRTLFDNRFDLRNAFNSNRAVVLWNGRDDVSELVPAGAYVAHLVVTPKQQGGERKQAQIPVVVATRLER